MGEGPLKNSLKSKVESFKLTDKVAFLGYREDVDKILNITGIFVCASVYESFGVSIAEAQACGIPVIATRIDNIKELIKDNETGILAEPKEPDKLAQAIHRLAGDQNLRKRLSENAYRFARKNYAEEKVINSIDKLYSELLRKKDLY